MRKFMNRVLVTVLAGAMLAGNVSTVSAKQLYDAGCVYADVSAENPGIDLQNVENNTEFTYSAADLEVLGLWGAEKTVAENGKLNVTFPKQYNQVFFKIPDEVDMSRFISATVDTDSGELSVKLCAADASYTSGGVVYGNSTITADNLDGNVGKAELRVLCLMSLSETELVKEIGNITFKLEPKQETADDGDTSDKTEFTYDAPKLEILALWGAEKTVAENGKLNVTFPKQYNQVFFKIPDEVDMSRFISATVDTDSGELSVKLCAADASYTSGGVVYGNSTITADNLDGNVGKAELRVLCLMSLSETELVKEIGNITFKLEPKAEDAVKTEFKYSMTELEQKAAWGVDVEEADGGHKLTYKSQYAQMFYVIPDEVDMTRIEYVSVEVDSTEEFSVKLCSADDDFTEAAVVYGSNVLRDSNLNENVPKSEIKILDLMSLTADTVTKTVKSVTFKLKEPSPVEVNDGSFKQCYKDKTNNNPIATQRYSADPSVMVYNGRVYVYATNDVYEYDADGDVKENSYGKVTTINCFSTTDFANWTDHGAIPVAGKNSEEGAAKWANNSWAPCAAHKTIDGKEKFFLYFADNGSGIGVLTADSPEGPWTDPLGKQLISRDTPTCDTVEWLFDPAVMVDDDGSAYLCFGGGVPSGKDEHPMTARIVKLGADMISLDGEPVTIDAPYLFEDSGINKINGKYVYSYCTNWASGKKDGVGTAVIAYMTSDSPMGPYTYVGTVLPNPSNLGGGGNNHHSIFEFNGELYIAYHTRSVDSQVFGKSRNYRSTHIDKLTVNEDGTINKGTPTMTGVAQLGNLNPYQTVQAENIFRQFGITVSGLGNTVVNAEAGSFIGIKGADFSKGLSTITVRAKAEADTTIDVRVGSERGTVIGAIEVKASEDFQDFTGNFEGLSGTRDLYFVFNGNVVLDNWAAAEGAVVDVEEEDTVEGIQYDVPNLKDVVTEAMGDENFIVGTAICLSDLKDEKEMALVKKHFNAITFGNELKPDAAFGYASKCPDTETAEINGVEITVPKLDFSRADEMLEYVYNYNKKHPESAIKIRGHVFTWHSQTPEWFFHVDYDKDKELCSKEEMTLRHEWYIKTMAEHYMGENSKYKDMFYGWDVVNEAVSDSRGTYRNGNENSTWWKVYGSNEFIINAFRFANKYVPADVELYYNDYGDCSALKSEGIAKLLKDVKEAEGTRIDAVGMQGHYQTAGSPSAQEFITAAKKYAAIVGKVQITELDFGVSDAYDGTDKTKQEEYTRLAYRYKEIYDAVKQLKAEGINMSGITVWGVVDKYSWLQTSSSVGGGATETKKQVPLLFDDDYQVKSAYWAFVDPTKLAPTIQEVTFTQEIDDEFTAGTELTINKADTSATIIPVWNENTIKFLANVKDNTIDETDAVTAYVKIGDDVKKVTVNRTDAVAIEDGYVAVVEVTGVEIQAFDTVTFDVVVTDGNMKAAFNDYTLSHDEKSDYFAKAELKPFAQIEKGTIEIGKDNSAVWNDVADIPLTVRLGAEAEATAKLLWDNENLYVQVTVKDAVLDATADAAHEKDSLEIFIDENNNKSTSYEEDDKQYRINYLNEHTFNGTNCVEENITSNVTLTEDGYVIEAAIKWTHEQVKSGTKIGLEIQINDAKGGKRVGTVSWADTTGMGWSSPAVFGTVVLYDKAAKEDKPGESETETPTEKPGESETEAPTEKPGEPETEAPTEKPSEPETEAPTYNPSESETEAPAEKPSEPETPTEKPNEPETEAPTHNPSESETEAPTEKPGEPETEAPTHNPSESETEAPTEKPGEPETEAPTHNPSESETEAPAEKPSEPETPTEKPNEPETEAPTHKPSESETKVPTQDDKAVDSSVLDRINNGDKIIIEKAEAGKGSYLPNDFVTALIDKGSQLILELAGADGKTLVKYTFDGTRFSKAPDNDFKLDVKYDDKSDVISKVKEQMNVPESSLYLCSFAHSGELNGELYVTVYTQYEEGTELRLFYYNDNTGSSEDMGQTVKAAQDGSATFRVTHFSSYILVKAADIRNDITPGETQTETQPAQPETDNPEKQYVAPSTGVNISSALYAAALVCVIIMICSAASVCNGRRKKK